MKEAILCSAITNPLFSRIKSALYCQFKNYSAVLLPLFCVLNAWSQTNPVIFRDDFNRTTVGPNWQADYNWSIKEGNAFNLTDGPGDALITTQSFNDSSFIIESLAKGFTSGYRRSMAIVFGQKDDSPDNAYVVEYFPDAGGRFILGRAEGNIFYPTVLDEVVVSPKLATDVYCRFKIERYKSGLIQVFLDQGRGYGSIPLLEAIDKVYPVLGRFGWQVSNETAGIPFYVDFIEARRPMVEKPAVPQKPAEDAFITQVTVANGKTYEVAKLTVGSTHYTDRPYTITSLPAYLNGASFIKTANDDKAITSATFLQAFIQQNVIAYVGYDPRATSLPAWLDGWTKTTDRIGTTDPGSSYLDVYSKVLTGSDIYPNPLRLGGNLAAPAAGSNMNYLFAVIPYPGVARYEAEEAKLSGPVIASNHPGYSGKGFVDFVYKSWEFIEWTVDISAAGSYSLGFTFAQGSPDNRLMNVSVNGVSKGVATFNNTDSWQSWAFYAWSPSILLQAGTNTIRLTSIGFSGPNIDYLSIIPSSQPPGVGAAARVASAESAASISQRIGNAPNPFQGNTLIRYNLAEKTLVRLAVYDLMGRQAALLVDGVQEAGEHATVFEAKHLPNGIYLGHLKTGNTTQVIRMILRK